MPTFDPNQQGRSGYHKLALKDISSWSGTRFAEAIHRGARDVLTFAQDHCGVETDRQHARAVMAHLFFLDGHFPAEQLFANRAQALLLAHWPAVQGVAAALVAQRRIEGEQVAAIVAAPGSRKVLGLQHPCRHYANSPVIPIG